jgi:hypothetical protein
LLKDKLIVLVLEDSKSLGFIYWIKEKPINN